MRLRSFVRYPLSGIAAEREFGGGVGGKGERIRIRVGESRLVFQSLRDF